ncbi:MAG: MCE family protein, partial [Planctomycetota bacterium]|nr:MCE family protein [Planctomycetota bacterium]
MTERLRNIAVGLTAIAGLVGLGILLLLFGSLPTMLERGYSVRVELPSAGGLSRGNRVRFAGIDVGAIVSVDFLTTPRPGVVAVARIAQDVVLREGVTARVQSPLIGGSPTLEFDPVAVAAD